MCSGVSLSYTPPPDKQRSTISLVLFHSVSLPLGSWRRRPRVQVQRLPSTVTSRNNKSSGWYFWSESVLESSLPRLNIFVDSLSDRKGIRLSVLLSLEVSLLWNLRSRLEKLRKRRSVKQKLPVCVSRPRHFVILICLSSYSCLVWQFTGLTWEWKNHENQNVYTLTMQLIC